MIIHFRWDLIFIVVTSIGLGILGTWFVTKFGDKVGLVDIPKDRSSHSLPTPKGGGIGILAAFFFLSFSLDIHWFFWVTAGAVSLVSFFGDKIDLSPKIRLLIHLFLSMVFTFNTGITKFINVIEPESIVLRFGLYLLFLVGLVIYQVGTANFYNFMDGINGIAGITGVIAFCLIGLVCYRDNQPDVYLILSIGISLACLGFLPFNFPKASVFMGDVSSILLGFVFASLVMLISKDFTELLCYSGFILPFYFDEFSTLIERIRIREPLTKAHRKHLYQVLVNEGGIAHWKVSLGYGFAQISVGAMLLLLIKPFGLVGLIGFYGVIFVMFVVVSNQVKIRIIHHRKLCF